MDEAYADKQLAALTKEDWQFISYAVEERFRRADPKPGEPPASKNYKAQRTRIIIALLNKSLYYGKTQGPN